MKNLGQIQARIGSYNFLLFRSVTDRMSCLYQIGFYRKMWICTDPVPFKNCQGILSYFNRKFSGKTKRPAAVFQIFIY